MKIPRVILLNSDEDNGVAGWKAILNPLELEVDHVSAHQVMSSPEIVKGYDLIIIDTGDSQNDIALCRMLRPVHRGALLLCADHPNESFMIEGYKAGADDYIIKSAGDLLLRAKVNAWCRRIQRSNFREK